MKKRWKPAHWETATKRTFMVPDDSWEFARTHPLGAAGLIRTLLEQEQASKEGRFRSKERETSLATPVGMMSVAAVPDGFVLHFEDTPVAYYQYDTDQPWPVIRIPGLPSQVMSICLHTDQTLSIPLKRGQTVSLPIPVSTVEKRMANARAQPLTKLTPSTEASVEDDTEN